MGKRSKNKQIAHDAKLVQNNFIIAPIKNKN